ncbi:MAG: PBP1A family penicillin-binding protein [Treponemataceae bacterium]
MRRLIFVYLFILLAILVGGSSLLGFMFARTKNIRESEEFTSFTLDLPSKVLDIRGDLMTEYASDEKRELISFNEVSPHLVHALLAREDRGFYSHSGFSIKAIFRAIIGKVFGKNLGGGSTITQQTSGNLYADRTERTLKRKIVELWWAIQMERRYSKDEIMELYLNKVYFGSGNIHGIEAAAKFYCNARASDLTPAESAILVIQLSNPRYNNPFEYPNTARKIQSSVLEQMVKMGYITDEVAKNSFEEYWAKFDYTRTNFSGFLHREDKAPWFSEYVRRELENLMYGTMDYYTGGYTIHTTCDLRHQNLAERFLLPGIEKANKDFARASVQDAGMLKRFNNLTALLALCFDIPAIKADAGRNQVIAMNHYRDEINPIVDMFSLMFDIQSLQVVTKRGAARALEQKEKTTVEGALICLENETGYITALVGGSEFTQSNQFIRATQGRFQAGSSIKPLYYSAAIDARVITAGSRLNDVPTVFENNAGVQFIPQNYSGKWKGPVLAYKALAISLNIPAVEVFKRTGFDAAIDRITNLTGITDPERIKNNFPRVFPLALGFSTFSPLEMSKAYAVFANQGRRVDPIAILNIEGRDGNILLDVERDLRIEQRKLGSAMQVISPQNAYIMTSMMKETISNGSMYWATQGGRKFSYKDEKTGKYHTMPLAGKTGTSQNWSDVWTVGYSPYYTAAVWFGFDRGGLSLGEHNEAAFLATPVWADFMYEIHKSKPYKNFIRPETGLTYVQVCPVSGQLLTEECGQTGVGLYFLSGTEPTEKCTYHSSAESLKKLGEERIREAFGDYDSFDSDDDFITIDPSIFSPVDDGVIPEIDAEMSIEDILKDSGLEDLPDVKVEVIPVPKEPPETKEPSVEKEKPKESVDKEENTESTTNPFL